MRRERHSVWDRITPWLVLACGIAATGAAASFAYWTAREQAELRFHLAVDDAQLAIKNRLEIYLALLRGGGAAFSHDGSMTRAEFHDYVDRLRISRNYPGIQGMGFSRRILPEEKQTVIRTAHIEGLTNFTLWPEREGETHAVLYLEPMDARNRQALGFDMTSEEIRRAAMEKARDTGNAVATAKVTLVQEIDDEKQPGFLIYTPVYRGEGSPDTVEERRRKLFGYVYAPFRASDLFAGIFSTHVPSLEFAAYAGAPVKSNLMHTTVAQKRSRNAKRRAVEVEIAGRPLMIVFHATEQFESTALTTLPPVTALLGVLVTTILYSATLAQRRAHRQAEAQQYRATQRAALRADVGTAFAVRQSSTHDILHACTEAIVRYLPAAFARVWTMSADGQMLHLQASSGIYTHLDGVHSRIPVGRFKIGLIAAEKQAHLTNDVPNDPRIGDREWARREHMAAFAGYPLMVEDRVIGVVALFSRERLDTDTLESLAGIADIIAQGLQRRQVEEALREAQEDLQQHATRLEERVAERTRSLEETVKSLEGFSYSVAHDLRAPLRTIHSFGSLLVEEHSANLAPPAQDYLRRMISAAGRMDDLIQDLLAYNRLGREELPFEVVSLGTAVAAVLNHIRDEIIRRNAEISVSEDLPSVIANQTLLQQVITNLLINALKFVEHGRTPQVRITARRIGGVIRVEVADNGIGIEPAQQKRIFGVFERLHPTKNFSGTGIGLAIVHKAIERMGGEVGVESESGRGSTFWFALRAAE